MEILANNLPTWAMAAITNAYEEIVFLSQNTAAEAYAAIANNTVNINLNMPAHGPFIIPALEVSESIPNYAQLLWNFLMERYSLLSMCTIIPFIFLTTSYFLLSAPLMVLEWLDAPFIRKYKIQPNRHNSGADTWRAFKYLLFSYALVIFPLDSSAFPVFKFLGFDMGPVLPRWYTIAFQMFIFLFCEDLAHYCFHRALHIRWLYPYIHYKHHEFRAPYGISASYAHPIEVVLLGIATFSGPLIVRPHILVFIMWAHLRQYTAIETHCGYDFPFSPANWIPFWAGARHHDYHHSHQLGNYASNFTWWDAIFGTNIDYEKHLEKQARKKALEQQQQQQQQPQAENEKQKSS